MYKKDYSVFDDRYLMVNIADYRYSSLSYIKLNISKYDLIPIDGLGFSKDARKSRPLIVPIRKRRPNVYSKEIFQTGDVEGIVQALD